MSNKMVKCKSCGQEIAESAKLCPNCGAKNKKPIYKKWWFYVVIAIVVIAIISGSSGGSDSTSTTSTSSAGKTTETAASSAVESTKEVTYNSYDVKTLFDELDANALSAQKAHKGEYVEIHGYLGTIDSSGNYIGVGAHSEDYDYFLKSIKCNIKGSNKKALTEQIMNMNTDDEIVVKGKITEVGEILGYTLTIDSIG